MYASMTTPPSPIITLFLFYLIQYLGSIGLLIKQGIEVKLSTIQPFGLPLMLINNNKSFLIIHWLINNVLYCHFLLMCKWMGIWYAYTLSVPINLTKTLRENKEQISELNKSDMYWYWCIVLKIFYLTDVLFASLYVYTLVGWPSLSLL